jgi:hypothetical protein
VTGERTGNAGERDKIKLDISEVSAATDIRQGKIVGRFREETR